MRAIKKYFNIENEFRFELGDWFALTMLINLILIMTIGLYASWLGLAVALINIGMDIKNEHRHLNDFITHFSGVALNVYFLTLLG